MILRFADCDVDLDRLEIRVDGTPVAVEPQVFDVLSYLIEHRDRMVPKEELLDNIWGDRFVSESALTTRIKSARRALGDDGRTQAIIKTIHGHGYRFVAEVEHHEAPPTDAPSATIGTARTEIESDESIEWPLVGRHDELHQLDRSFHEPGICGVLVTGPAGIGKTRLARHYVRGLEASGRRVAQVHGHAEAAAVPIACLAHVLPADVLDAGQHSGEFAHAVVFRRARQALEEFVGDDQVVFLVDNADQIDELSNALLASLADAGNAFLLLTQRAERGEELVMNEHVRGGTINQVHLAALDDTDLDVLLYRVLEGPIDLTSLEQLTRLSLGRPGALRQLLDTTLGNNSLTQESGVWRLTGAIRAAAATDDHVLLSALDPAVLAGAELLAIAGALDLDVATELIGADELDTLDRSGLIALTSGTTPAISIAQPHIGILLLDNIGPLRARRHKSRLVAALSQLDLSPADELRVVRWSIETGGLPNPDVALEAARLAVASADNDDGDVLLDHLDRHQPSARSQQLRGELAFRRGQIEAAERLFASIGDHQLDAATEATVIRRRATIMFHIRGHYDDALDHLAAHEADADEPERSLLGAHWVGLQAFLGRTGDVVERCAFFPDELSGQPRLEVMRAEAAAAVLDGRFASSLDILRKHATRALELPPGAAQAANEVATSITIAAHVGAGDMASATEMIRRYMPIGQRTALAWLPLAAARAHIAAGRPRTACEELTPALAAVRNQNLMHHEPLLVSVMAAANTLAGRHEDGRAQATVAEEAIPGLRGQLRSHLVLALAETWMELGERDRVAETALEWAAEARDIGASVTEAELLSAAGLAGAASDVVERVTELAAGIEGSLWPVRARHIDVLSRGDHEALAVVAAEYRRMGYIRLAGLAEAEL